MAVADDRGCSIGFFQDIRQNEAEQLWEQTPRYRIAALGVGATRSRASQLIFGEWNNPPCRASFSLEGPLMPRTKHEYFTYRWETSLSGWAPNWAWSRMVRLIGKLNMKAAFAAAIVLGAAVLAVSGCTPQGHGFSSENATKAAGESGGGGGNGSGGGY